MKVSNSFVAVCELNDRKDILFFMRLSHPYMNFIIPTSMVIIICYETVDASSASLKRCKFYLTRLKCMVFPFGLEPMILSQFKIY